MPSNAQVAREEDQAPNLQFEDIFSLRKPRDARAGLASGCKSMLKGVLAGSVGLVAAPLIGAHQEGVHGFAKGTAAGVAGAVVLPMCGFMIGSAQVVRGVINTPEAVRQTMLGRYWDDDTRTWIDAPSLALALDDDAVRRAWHSGAPRRGGGGGQNGSAAGHRGGSGPGSSGALVEGEESFYELLGVPQDASPELIKKQYYILARRLHPDKNPDDPQAKERFQRLGEAYQVLCNPELRRRYDMHGSEGLDINFMDAGEFFTALFGSQKFDHLVGELVIAAAARSGNELTPSQLKRLQLAREERLCVMLAALLRRWVEEDYSGFKESMAKEAAELASASFGEVMLHTVGSVYEAQAQIFLGGLINGSIAALKARGHSLKSQVTAASLALKVYQTQQQLEKLDKQQEQQQEVLRQQRQQQQQQTHESQQQQQQQQQSEPQPGTSAPFWREGGGNAGPTSSSNPGSPGSRGGSGWSSPAGPSRQGSTFLGEVQPPAELNGRQSPQERRQVRSSAHPSAAAPGPGDAPTSPTASAAAAAAAAASSAAAAAAAAASAAAAAEAAAAERARLEEQALPVMLDAMWAANVLDIEATLRHVCRRVLNDAQVSKHVRRKRASGLLELGRIFRAAKAPATNGVGSAGSSSSSPRCSRNRKAGQQQQQQRHQKTAKQHMEDAMMHVMEKRMQAADAQQ